MNVNNISNWAIHLCTVAVGDDLPIVADALLDGPCVAFGEDLGPLEGDPFKPIADFLFSGEWLSTVPWINFSKSHSPLAYNSYIFLSSIKAWQSINSLKLINPPPTLTTNLLFNTFAKIFLVPNK